MVTPVEVMRLEWQIRKGLGGGAVKAFQMLRLSSVYPDHLKTVFVGKKGDDEMNEIY